MKTMILSRFSSRKCWRQRAVPSAPSRAELREGRASVDEVGVVATCACHKRKAVHSPIKSLGKETMDHHCCLRARGRAQELPGMLALFEDPILNDTAPVIGIKHGERIAHLPIG